MCHARTNYDRLGKRAPAPAGGRPHFLEDAKLEDIIDLALDAPELTARSLGAGEREGRMLLALTLVHLKRFRCEPGTGQHEARRITTEFVERYGSSENVRWLVMDHVAVILRYGWSVYRLRMQRDRKQSKEDRK